MAFLLFVWEKTWLLSSTGDSPDTGGRPQLLGRCGRSRLMGGRRSNEGYTDETRVEPTVVKALEM
jgi:hypothetical protein